MKKKLLTIVSASFAAVALAASCNGGGKNAGKHPKITFYGIDSLSIIQNGKEVSKDNIDVSYGKDLELTFKPNNDFAAITRWTPYGEEKEDEKLFVNEDVKIKSESTTKLVDANTATPYVGFGNYLYPEDYPLARNVAYTYKVNDDGSATLKVNGEYFQRNLIISFDRGVTGNNDYCCPVQQLGLSDITSSTKSTYWYDLNSCYSTSGEGAATYDDNLVVLSKVNGEINSSDLVIVRNNDSSSDSIKDSLLNDHATITLQRNIDVPVYLVKDIKFAIEGGHYEDNNVWKKDADLDIKVESNNLGQYFVNIPFLNEGNKEAILEKTTKSEEHPFGYKLKYEKIKVIPKHTKCISNGIELNRSGSGESTISWSTFEFDDFSGVVGRTEKVLTPFTDYSTVKNKNGVFKIADHLPTAEITLNSETINLDFNSSDCETDEWTVEETDTYERKTYYDVYRFKSVKSKKNSNWQLTVYASYTYLTEQEKDNLAKIKWEDLTNEEYYYDFNPTSYTALYESEDKPFSTVKVNISVK